MKRVLSILLALVIVIGILPMSRISSSAADINAIKQQITNTYNICKTWLYENTGLTSFNGWCGLYVSYQIKAVGIGDYGNGYQGNEWFNAIADGSKTWGGYTVVKISGGSALNTLISRYGNELYNVVMCYPYSVPTAPEYTTAYGHVMFIHAVVNNTVYFSESYTNGSEAEGAPLSMSVSDFNARYNSWYGNAQGCIWYSKPITTGILLNQDTLTIKPQESFTLTATVSPSNATDKTVTWTSSDTSVATVSNGKVTGLKRGYTLITAKASGGQTATCKVIVFNSDITPITSTTYNGNRYELYDDIASWYDAKEFCESKGGHLAVITSKEEDNIVASLVQGGSRKQYFIGGTDEIDEGTWKWVTGEAFNYVNFASGEDADSTGYDAEDYLFIKKETRMWGDIRSYSGTPTDNGFVCEYEYKMRFPDVSKNDWYYDAVKYCDINNFITGYSNGKFGPADNLKRQDFVVILARIAGANLDSYKNSTGGLKDVVKGSYYAPAVAWAVENEIVTGYANGKFGVGDNITREQVATILYRYMGEPTITATTRNSVLSPYADKDKISSYALNAMAWAVKNGVISGKNATTLAPTATASRAEIATIVMRMDKAGMFAE